MSRFLRGLWLIASIELRQRVRGVAWYVLLGVFVLLLFIVSALLAVTLSYSPDGAGSGLFSTIIYFVLLLGSLVAPALSGNAINGDRESGTLATTQVTLVSTPQLVLGKFLAAWLTALAFLVAAVPFLLFALVIGGVAPATVGVSILVLAVELGVVSAIGVGLSGIIRRPLFSVVVTYLVVAALSVGTLIAFGLGGLALQTRVTVQDSYSSDPSAGNLECDLQPPREQIIPRFDEVWWILASNPYVVLADAVPPQYGTGDYPIDLFGTIQLGVRAAQLTPDLHPSYSDCEPSPPGPSPREIVASTVPGWFVGLLVQLVLAVAALWGAVALTRAPSRRLAPGSRIA